MKKGQQQVRVVSLRELNQHSGRILREARRAGVELLITDHNRVVWRVIPEEDAPTDWDRLVQRGLIAREARHDKPLPACLPTPDGVSLQEVLAEVRGDR